MEQNINIIIADDHDMVRQGLEAIIRTVPEFNIVATANDGQKAIDLVEKHRPNVVLLDIVMPTVNGIQAACRIKKQYPEVRVLMLSMEISSEYIKTAFQNEIDGYIPKNADVTILIEAIRSVARGEKYYDQKVKDYIFKYYVGEESLAVPKIDNLSEREVQVLKLISNGIPNKEIGDKLFISPKTVEAHRNNILKKLHLKSTADLVKFSIVKNITEIPKSMTST
ncbi:MAG: response regulator transcription factor [Cyclobacteriaceae bacterium]